MSALDSVKKDVSTAGVMVLDAIIQFANGNLNKDDAHKLTNSLADLAIKGLPSVIESVIDYIKGPHQFTMDEADVTRDPPAGK